MFERSQLHSAPAEFPAWSTGEASRRDGEIAVTTTEFGLPLRIRVRPPQLRRNPGELSEDLLRLCRLAANRAAMTRRSELAQLGLCDQALDLLGLPTPELVEQAELLAESQFDYEPRSWLDRDGGAW